MREVAGQIKTLIGMTFSNNDLADCQKTLDGLNVFAEGAPAHRAAELIQYRNALHGFLAELNDVFGLSIVLDDTEEDNFLLYISKINERSKGGHVNSNFFKREIHRRYPMEVHLICICFFRHFSIEVPEPEVSNLALFISSKTDMSSYLPDCLIISDLNPSILYHLKRDISQNLGYLLKSAEIVPDYRYMRNLAYYEDKIAITTDETIALHLPDAILVKPFLSSKKMQEVREKVETKTKEMRARAIARIRKQYGCERVIVFSDHIKDMIGFFEICGENKPDDKYEFVMDINAMLYPSIHYGAGINNIRLYLMKYPIPHRGSQIRMIVCSDYYTDTMEIKQFYDCIRDILNTQYIHSLEKQYLK
jgi:hypothetical protein